MYDTCPHSHILVEYTEVEVEQFVVSGTIIRTVTCVTPLVQGSWSATCTECCVQVRDVYSYGRVTPEWAGLALRRVLEARQR